MANSGDDESFSLPKGVKLAWEDIDFDTCNEERLEVEEEKEGKLKKLLRCVGIGK